MYVPLQSIFWNTISRSGAVVARWAHNPKVACSNQASATRAYHRGVEQW